MRHALVASVIAFALPACADVMAFDTEFGQDTGTVDTAQGLVFLDLTITEGLSYNQVIADPTYNGWRHASFAEVRAMWLNAGLEDWTGSDFEGYSGPGLSNGPGVSNQVLALVDLVGGTVVRATFGPTQYFSAVGMTSDTNSTGLAAATELYTQPLATEYALRFYLDPDVPNDFAGHWLVKPVPAPGVAVPLALAGVAVSRRRRQQ